MITAEYADSRDSGAKPNNRIDERRRLMHDIADEFRMTYSVTGITSLSRRTREALLSVPRHQFVPNDERDLAYFNHPLPIGYRQTISQPFIVALMTELLEVRPDHKILEIGTGSGYQAAVLAQMARHVYSVEIVGALAVSAAERLGALGYGNVEVRSGDGALGWPEHAPYDRVIVTAAAREIPPALVEQLAPGGRMVAPIGDARSQTLILLLKAPDGQVSRRSILPVAFVPLTGKENEHTTTALETL